MSGHDREAVSDGRPRRQRPADAVELPATADPVEATSVRDLRSAFEHAPIGVAVTSPTGVIRVCNAALDRLLGSAPGTLVGRTFFDVTHPDDLAEARETCERMQTGGPAEMRHECRFVQADGAETWVMVSTARVPGEPGEPSCLVMHVQDISDRKELEAELTHRALHDPLTGLPNRALLEDRLGHALARARRSDGPTCVFVLDLDGFKTVNDTHGHAAGDEVLRQLATRLSAALRDGDTAARLGGDEFVVLCEDTDPRQAAQIAARLRAVVAEPFEVDGHRVLLTAAVGVGASPLEDGESEATVPADLLRRADMRMYDVKKGLQDQPCGGPASPGRSFAAP